MKPPAKNIEGHIATRANAKPNRDVRTIQAHGLRGPACRTPDCGAPHAHGQSKRPGSGIRNLNQAVSPANLVNRKTAGASPSSSKTHGYRVQMPIPLGHGSQQIRATIQGTPQVAGSVEISRAGGGRAYISNLQVDQQHRRRGVAAKLIDAAVSAARRQGFRAASLEARPSDNGISPQALVAMYRRQGFKSVGKSQRGSPLMERKLY